MGIFSESEINNRNIIINNITNKLTGANANKNYYTMLVESEMIKKQQDTLFILSSITAVILVIVTINSIKK